jgi:RNA polymerase-binding transcription factor DksA
LITASRTDELDAMLNRFEEQYEAHTERLARLMSRRRDRRTAVYDLAEISSCRKALADTARMLQRMADRDFGRCGLCSAEISVDRLSVCPDVRYCGDCEQAIPA